jgi:excinuclease ABC subunit A
MSTISVRGCRVHNLKNVDVDLPRGKLIAVCGRSGSGKTSLALDTLYAEGQRCYIESFSAYTRQFLERLDRPDCDSITGIPPAIAVTRAGGVRTNRSTVATATEIAEHLRLLFAKASKLFCHGCGKPVVADDPTSVADEIASMDSSVRVMIGFDVFLPNKSEANEILLGLQQEGYLRLIVDGETVHLSDDDRPKLAQKIKRSGMTINVVVDRVGGGEAVERSTESLESAMAEGGGQAIVWTSVVMAETTDKFAGHETLIDGRPMWRRVISRELRCNQCNLDFSPPVPRLFNFNHPLGACSKCEGFGDSVDVDMDLVVPDPEKSLKEGAIAPWNTPSYEHELHELLTLAPDVDLPIDVPYKKLKAKHLKVIREGSPQHQFGGLNGFFAWLDRKKYKMHIRVFASRFRSYRTCEVCDGKRLKPEALAYKIGGLSISELMSSSADEVADFLNSVSLTEREKIIAREPIEQILRRIGFLRSVGLGYLQLSRPLRTLSGGEIQRVSLTSTLGSSLVNMLYVLDEPTAGLHPVDVDSLSKSILQLRDRGNTVIVVEHNETMIRLADWVIEVGPDAGVNGGKICFEGSAKQMIGSNQSLTGDFLAGRRGHSVVNHRPRQPKGWIALRKPSGNNLQIPQAKFPTGVLCLVTGVSGSGKSSLIQDTLFPAVSSRVTQTIAKSLPFESITGLGGIDDCLMVDQAPISRSARSVPVTYVHAYDAIRKAFASTVDARVRNLSPGHFSFNSDKGQCPACEGAGIVEIDMQFLADISVVCAQCNGSRFRDEILNVTYRDRSIAEVMEMTVTEAISFFRGEEAVQQKLQTLVDVGLDYIRLGQSVTTLSSGEGQRLKLAGFLASAKRKRTLFLMDEPTTGLHFADIVRLVDCFDALIADGHSLIVVEHNPMLIRAADYVIDLGPGAAAEGGRIIAEGTPAEVAKVKDSATGKLLAELMRRDAS